MLPPPYGRDLGPTQYFPFPIWQVLRLQEATRDFHATLAHATAALKDRDSERIGAPNVHSLVAPTLCPSPRKSLAAILLRTPFWRR